MDRIYTFKSGVIVICTCGGYMSAEEIRTLEKVGDELLSVKHGDKIILAEKEN